jgi:hypothetical protein
MQQEAEQGLKKKASGAKDAATRKQWRLTTGNSEKVNSSTAAHALLWECKPFVHGLQRTTTSSRGKEQKAAKTVIRLRCIAAVLRAMFESLDNSVANKRHGLANEALALCLVVVETCKDTNSSAELTNKECDLVRNCLQKCLTLLPELHERVPEIVISLASTESKRVWVTIANPTIKWLVDSVHDQQGQLVSAFTVLFEAAIRQKGCVSARVQNPMTGRTTGTLLVGAFESRGANIGVEPIA